MNVKDYCSSVHRKLTGFKVGLHEVIERVEGLSGSEKETFESPIQGVKGVISQLDAGLHELENSCPSDWSSSKAALDGELAELEEALTGLAARMNVTLADTTAWV